MTKSLPVACAFAAILFTLVRPAPAQSGPQSYTNPAVGLEMTYPGNWQVIKKSVVDGAVASAEGTDQVSQETADATSFIALTLAKPRVIDGVAHNPNVNVMVVPLPPEQAEGFDLEARMQSQMATVGQIPGAEIAADALPLENNPEVPNFSARIPQPNGTATQYYYTYWRSPRLVQIAFTVSHPEDEAEVKEMIRSIRIKEPDAPAADGN